MALGDNRDLCELDKDIFKPLINIESLNLEWCGFTELDDSIFETLTEVKNIDLTFNLIKKLPKSIIKCTKINNRFFI